MELCIENEVQHEFLFFEHFFGDISFMNRTNHCELYFHQQASDVPPLRTMQCILVDTVYYGEENSVSAGGWVEENGVSVTRHGRGTTDERNRALKPRRLLHVPNIQLKCTHRKYSVSEVLPNKHWLAMSVGRSEHKKNMILQSHLFKRNKQANNIDKNEKICNSIKVAANLRQT